MPAEYNIYTKEQYEAQLAKHKSLDWDRVGFWRVLGEDGNADMGGSHHQPLLGIVKGRFKDVLRWAMRNRGYFTWGGGGDITPLEIVDLTEGRKRPKVGDQIEVCSKQLNIPWTKVLVDEVEEYGFRVVINIFAGGATHGGLPWDSDEWRWPS